MEMKIPGDTGRNNENLLVTLMDYLDVTREEVGATGHGGVGFVCDLKQLDYKAWHFLLFWEFEPEYANNY